MVKEKITLKYTLLSSDRNILSKETINLEEKIEEVKPVECMAVITNFLIKNLNLTLEEVKDGINSLNDINESLISEDTEKNKENAIGFVG
jgi:hypothetical protein